MSGPSAVPAALPAPDDQALDRLQARFAAQEILASEWTHQAHLLMGAWHVFHFGSQEALERLRAGIRRLNQAHGTPETPTRGYHETITGAYVQLLALFLDRFSPETSLGTRVAALLASPLSARDALLAFYDRDRLMSPEARAAWLPPQRPFRVDE
jgi:hypothetical protein